MELKSIRGALTRADHMGEGARSGSLPPTGSGTALAAVISLQQQQQEQLLYHTPHLYLSLRSTGVASADTVHTTSGSIVDMSLSRNALPEEEGGEEVQQSLIEMLQGRHPLQLQVRGRGGGGSVSVS